MNDPLRITICAGFPEVGYHETGEAVTKALISQLAFTESRYVVDALSLDEVRSGSNLLGQAANPELKWIRKGVGRSPDVVGIFALVELEIAGADTSPGLA